MKTSSRVLLAVLVLVGLGALGYAYRSRVIGTMYSIRLPHATRVEPGLIRQDLEVADFTVMATGLKTPWEMAFLPNGEMLVTERPGRIAHIHADGALTSIPVEGVKEIGEGGLLGIALHPDFAQNGWLYLYMTFAAADGSTKNRVDRYRFEDDQLLERTTIIQDMPGAQYHDGGQLAFGPDRKLYITTGDATDATRSQNLGLPAGKILRLNDDGTIPSDNPFKTAIWSYGHRNVQGIAWDKEGRLWATEHGRSGVLSGLDELNLILPGKNYGWPTIQGDEKHEGMMTPVVNSGPDDTWAPSGAAYFEGVILFGGLRGASLYQAMIDADPVVVKANFEDEYGRIRAVAVGPDQMIYFTTSNTDGRGVPKEGDDKVIRVNPRLFR